MTVRREKVESGLPQRWALILLAGLLLGLIFGALTLIQFGLPAAVLSGLTAAGVTVKGLHEMLEH